MRGAWATRSSAPCELCTWLGPSPQGKLRYPAARARHGLSIALVDDDVKMGVAAREMVRVQRDGWALEIYHPCPPASEALGLKDPPRPMAPVRRTGRGTRPDLILIGVQDHEERRLLCVRRLKALAPDLPVLIVSRQRNSATIAQYCIAGADGWLTKPLPPAELDRAVRTAAQGGTVLCPQAVAALMDFLHQVGKSASVHGLTQRQREIVFCLGENLTYGEVAQRLGIETNTVHVHVNRLLRRFAVHSREQLVKRLLGGGGARCNPSVAYFNYWIARASGV